MNTPQQRLTIALLIAAIAALPGCSAAQEPEGSTVIGFYGAPDAGPAPLEVHFHPFGEDAVVNTVTKWAWDFGDGGTSAEQYTSHTYTSDGTYTVTLNATTSGGETHKIARAAYIRIAAGATPTEEEDGEEEHQEGQEEEMGEEAETETAPESPSQQESEPGGESQSEGGANGAVFIHHSCGENWLNSGLHRALLAKPYIDDRNDITYGTELRPDPGRPASLGSPAGDLTDMHHWILWFNDYFNTVRAHGCRGGANRIILFKSCFPNSHIDDAGTEPGEPFGDWKAVANYKAVFRHAAGPGKTYEHEGHNYHALGDIFAQHPDTLFIYVTAPPECRQETTLAIAGHARDFNDWLKLEWLPGYIRATKLHNVAVFDWFDLLAATPADSSHANFLRAGYGGESGDSHPNGAANACSTEVFATGPKNFLDQAWQAFTKKPGQE
jgi:PKD domain